MRAVNKARQRYRFETEATKLETFAIETLDRWNHENVREEEKNLSALAYLLFSHG